MIKIPGGPFQTGDQNTEKLQAVELYTFFIDRFEVSNREFKAWSSDHPFPKGADAHPVTRVNWDEANRFCLAQGKRLPSSLEWEKAARGLDGRIYPWGNKNLKKKPHPFFSGIVKRRVGLNKKDISYFGVRDMAGSVWEWTSIDSGAKKVIRGGLWNHHLDYEYSKTFETAFADPTKKFIFLGFRCAK